MNESRKANMGIGQAFNRTKKLLLRQLPIGGIPQFVFIVGAQKAGTTALHSYLSEHPMVFGGAEKELGFFNRDAMYGKGINYYRHLFPIRPNGTHALDSTPEYMYQKDSAERIHAFRSDAKIIMLLREPVSRAFSSFNMYQQLSHNEWFRQRLQIANPDANAFYMPLAEGNIEPDIHYFLDRETAIINGKAEGEEPALIRRGIYAPQIERFIRLFGRENVLVLFSDDLKEDTENAVKRVLSFIGLDPLSGVEYSLKHVREYTADNTGRVEIKRYAGALFEKDKKDLHDIFHLDVPW